MNARGRNGNFVIDSFQVNGYSVRDEELIFIDVYSKRKGKKAPMMLIGTPEEVRGWLENVLYEVKKKINNHYHVEVDGRPLNVGGVVQLYSRHEATKKARIFLGKVVDIRKKEKHGA